MSVPLGPGMRIIGDTPEPAIVATMSCMSESPMFPDTRQLKSSIYIGSSQTMFAVDYDKL